MAFPFRFLENVKIVPGLARTAANGAGAADRVCLKDYAGVAILVTQTQGGADSENITFHKATAASGGTEDTSNAIPNWWKCEDVTEGTTADTWTKGDAVAAGAYIATSAAAAGTSFYLIDIQASELPDSTADYDFVEFNSAGAGSASNYISCVYLLYGPRYAQASLPSAQA